jgi:alkylated DNA repair dioxygenase AlkB
MKLPKDIKRYQLGEGELMYIPNWAADPDKLYEEAKKLSFTPEIIAGRDGKPVTIKERQTVDFGAEYQYGKYSKQSIPWQPFAAAIRQKLEQQLGGRQLVQCACNRYPNSKGYISAHVDKNTPINGVSTPPNLIISLSLYAPHAQPRHMALRPIRKGQEANDLITLAEAVEKQALILELAPGSLVVFNGILNHMFKHAIPQEREETGERISLTYREFV